MDPKERPRLHARDHLPGGADPLELVFPTSRYSFAIINDPAGGLVLYWKLDELGNTTTKVVDWSGNGHDGVFYGSPLLGEPGLADQTAVGFDGSDDAAGISTDVPGIQGFGKMTIEFWVTTTQSPSGSPALVASDTASSDGRFFKVRLGTGGAVDFAIFTTAAVGHSLVGSTPINDGLRHYVVCEFDGADMVIYVDNVEDARTTPSMGGHPLANRNHGFWVGVGSPVGGGFFEDPHFHGVLDEVALWTTALPLDSIATHWLAGSNWFLASGQVDWFVGAGAPSSTLGVDNDLYLDDSSEDVYLKITGTWTLIGNIASGGGGSPSGSAGGALDGTYPNPGIAASVAGAGLAESSDVLSVNVDGTTIEIATDTLQLKNVGPGATGPIGDGTHVPVVTINAKGQVTGLTSAAISGGAPSGSAGGALDGTYPNPGLAASVAGAGLAETSDVLSVNVDGSTIEINTDTLRVKDAGITADKLSPSKTGNDGKWLRLASGALVWDSIDAVDVAIADAGSFYSSTDVEGALQEIGASGVVGAGALGARLFDSTLGADAASIDTGASGVGPGYSHLLVVLLLRSTQVTTFGSMLLTFNNDTGANYANDEVHAQSTATGANANVSNNGMFVIAPGASATTGFFGAAMCLIPNYTDTSKAKAILEVGGAIISLTSGTNNRTESRQGIWSGTAAINQVAITAAASANFKAGSRMTIYGLL